MALVSEIDKRDSTLNQRINGYHQDSESHWVAELECGHAQHVRHDPPWMERPWVTTPEGRATRLGHFLNCVKCDEMGAKVAQTVIKKCRDSLVEAYLDAGVSGLCGEGQWEAALGSLQSLDPQALAKEALACRNPVLANE